MHRVREQQKKIINCIKQITRSFSSTTTNHHQTLSKNMFYVQQPTISHSDQACREIQSFSTLFIPKMVHKNADKASKNKTKSRGSRK